MTHHINIKKKIAFLLIYISVGLSMAQGQQSVWPLTKCVQVAQENNLTLKGASLSLANAEVDKKQALNAKYPDLSTSSNVYWNFGRTIDPTSNTFTTQTFFRNGLQINTGVTLFNGFVIKNGVKQAEINSNAIKQDKEQVLNNIALDVATFYLNALFAKENIIIAQSNLDLSKKSAAATKTLIDAGSKAENEILDAEAQIAQDEQALLVAQNNFNMALLRLRQAINTDEVFDVEMPENIPLLTDPETIASDALYTSALKSQPAIKSSELKVKSADVGVDIAKGQKYPLIGFGGTLGTNYSNQGIRLLGSETTRVNQRVYLNNQAVDFGIDQQIPITSKANYLYQFDKNMSYGLGFNINMPILTNYRTSANIERAKITVENARLNLETNKQTLKSTVETALTDARAAKSKYAASEKSLKALQLAFTNLERKQSIGTANILDVNNARTRLDNAKSNYLISKYDYIFKAKVLDFYLGNGISL
jgi:outer membrane protein